MCCPSLIFIKQEGVAWGNTKLSLPKHLGGLSSLQQNSPSSSLSQPGSWDPGISPSFLKNVFDTMNYLKQFNSSFPSKDRLLTFSFTETLKSRII